MIGHGWPCSACIQYVVRLIDVRGGSSNFAIDTRRAGHMGQHNGCGVISFNIVPLPRN
jgi:hypothetical protein